MEKLKLEFEKNIEKDLNFIEKKEKICKKIIDYDNKLLKDYLNNHRLPSSFAAYKQKRYEDLYKHDFKVENG